MLSVHDICAIFHQESMSLLQSRLLGRLLVDTPSAYPAGGGLMR